MVTKEQIKNLVDQIPEEKLEFVEPILRNLLAKPKMAMPKGNLGLKEQINRETIYDDVLAHRY